MSSDLEPQDNGPAPPPPDAIPAAERYRAALRRTPSTSLGRHPPGRSARSTDRPSRASWRRPSSSGWKRRGSSRG